MTVHYDPSKLSVLGTLLRWRGTLFPLVIRTPGFWIFIVFHSILTACKSTDSVSFTPISWSVIASVTGLLVFFIVFYGSQCYNRMQMFFGHCIGLSGTTMNWVELVHNGLRGDPALHWNCVRHILAALHILYYTLNESYGSEVHPVHACIHNHMHACASPRTRLRRSHTARTPPICMHLPVCVHPPICMHSVHSLPMHSYAAQVRLAALV